MGRENFVKMLSKTGPSGFADSGEKLNEHGGHATGLQDRQRPLSMAWISEELLAETIEVWSEAYGRVIGEDEAVEILMIVKRLGEVLLKAQQVQQARQVVREVKP